MGAVAKNDNVKQRNKKKNSATKQKFGKQGRNGVHPQAHSRPHPPLGNRQFPPRFALGIGMRSRPPFPPGMRPPPPPGIGMRPPPPPPPGMRPPPPGMRMPPPPPLFRNRAPMPPRPLIPPPGPKMGPRGPPPPPMQLRSRNRPPLMGPPPLMRPPPPMMGPRPRRFPPPPPPPMLPPSKMRQLKNKIQHPRKNKRKQILNPVDLSSPWVTVDIKKAFDDKDTMYLAAKASSKPEDWDKFKEQRSKCEKMYKAAKLEYIGKHPEEVRIPQLMPNAQNTPVITAPLDFTADVVL